LDIRRKLLNDGKASIESVCGALERFTKAGAAICETPIEKVKHYEFVISIANSLTTSIGDISADRLADSASIELLKYLRLDSEIELHIARKAARDGGKPKLFHLP